MFMIGFDFFIFRGAKRMHLRTLCGTWPKQYPLKSKIPCFLARQWPRNRVSFTSGPLSTGAIRRTSALYVVACLDSLFAVFSRVPVWGCLSERRATHSPRNMVIPGLLVSCGAKVAPPARSAAIRPPAIRRHVSKTQAAVTPTNLRSLADSTGDRPDLHVGRLE